MSATINVLLASAAIAATGAWLWACLTFCEKHFEPYEELAAMAIFLFTGAIALALIYDWTHP